MEKFNNVSKDVKEVLINIPAARKDDRVLIFHLLSKRGFPTKKASSVVDAMTLINFETVRRARQEIQRSNPKLRDKSIYYKRHKRAKKITEFFGNKRKKERLKK